MLVVVGVSWDLNWFLQLLLSVIVVAVGVHIFVKTTGSASSPRLILSASSALRPPPRSARAARPSAIEIWSGMGRNFEGDHHHRQHHLAAADSLCAVCATPASKRCSRCKAVRYCSQVCQMSHWKSGHRSVCKDFHDASVRSSAQFGVVNSGLRLLLRGVRARRRLH